MEKMVTKKGWGQRCEVNPKCKRLQKLYQTPIHMTPRKNFSQLHWGVFLYENSVSSLPEFRCQVKLTGIISQSAFSDSVSSSHTTTKGLKKNPHINNSSSSNGLAAFNTRLGIGGY